jgi:AGCS family alanine or glycine:cation symporter
MSGLVLSIVTTVILIGGIKWVSAINDRLVPFVFVLYSATIIWIFLLNYNRVPAAISLIFRSLFSTQGAAGFLANFGFMSASRVGLAKGIQSTESGVGFVTFPHSASNSNNYFNQAVLSMLSVYSNVFLTMLTGLTILITGDWLQPETVFNVNLFSKILSNHFPQVGSQILILCGILFGSGTILGNSYNGSRCFHYLFGNKNMNYFYLVIGFSIFFGAISSTTFIWTLVDFFIVPVAIPNMIAILILAWRKDFLFQA